MYPLLPYHFQGWGRDFGAKKMRRYTSQMLHVSIIYLHYVKNGHIQEKCRYRAILCDLFGMVKWPFQRLSDLQPGYKKVTAWITWYKYSHPMEHLGILTHDSRKIRENSLPLPGSCCLDICRKCPKNPIFPSIQWLLWPINSCKNQIQTQTLEGPSSGILSNHQTFQVPKMEVLTYISCM